MIFISHRGNLNGADADNENHPEYIKNALDEGFLRVEVPDRDKRLKEYHLTEESISFIERLKTF